MAQLAGYPAGHHRSTPRADLARSPRGDQMGLL